MDNACNKVNVTFIGSCFGGFLQEQFSRKAATGSCAHGFNFQTSTMWQRVDAVVDIINGNIPDHDLVNFYIQNGYWESNSPLGIEVKHPITTSEWFARAILNENIKAEGIVNDTPDLLVFDSLSDWRHPLYRHRRGNWKCFLGRILFKDEKIAERFNNDFEFVQLLDVRDINCCLKTVIGFFKRKNPGLKAAYIHFPAMPDYLENKWVKRAAELESEVAHLKNELGEKRFYQLIIPRDMVRPITDPAHPHYSKDIWNHFEAEVYEYCADSILEWIANEADAGHSRCGATSSGVPDMGQTA